MIRSTLYLVVAAACFAAAPLAAQQPQPVPARGAAPAAATQSPGAGPRLAPEFKSFRPKLAQEEAAATAAAAADRTVITISTLGLVIIAILLILLLT